MPSVAEPVREVRAIPALSITARAARSISWHAQRRAAPLDRGALRVVHRLIDLVNSAGAGPPTTACA